MKANSNAVRVGVLCTLVVAAGASIAALARRGYILPEVGEVINFIVTPDDYFRPIARAEISRDKSEYRLQATHKYPAMYEVRLTMTSDITDKRFLSLRASVDVRSQGKTVFHSEARQSGGFAKPDIQSLVLGAYYVPNPVPIGDSVDIEVNFLTPLTPLLPNDRKLFIEVVAAPRG